jgi:hypothetical protein
MMSLLFGDCSHAVYKIERLLEIRKGKGAREVVLVNNFPVRPVRQLLVNVSEFLAF